MTEYIEKQWREITSRNPVRDAEFTTGLKDFKFSVGQGYGFIPNLSYFRVELELTVGGSVPTRANQVAFAESPIGNMFNNIYFNMGGQTVSSLTQNLGQCEILKNRLTKSKAYNETVGKIQGFDPQFVDRQVTLTPKTTGPLEYQDVAEANRQGKNTTMFIWKPALGIFDTATPMGAGEYDIQLNPSQDYVLACIQSFKGNTTSLVVGDQADQVNVKVKQFRFYACMVRTNLPASGVETLHLMEMSVHTINQKADTNVEINDEVSVPSSTRALTLFLQDAQAGKHSDIPPSKYGIVNDLSALSLRNYQIQYANMTKPTVRYDSLYDTTKDTLQQRYINCALESGQFFNPAGFESYADYLERGPFLHESFVKAADNLATRVHVVASYDSIGRDARLFVIAHYSSTVQITRHNGLIVDLKQLNV